MKGRKEAVGFMIMQLVKRRPETEGKELTSVSFSLVIFNFSLVLVAHRLINRQLCPTAINFWRLRLHTKRSGQFQVPLLPWRRLIGFVGLVQDFLSA